MHYAQTAQLLQSVLPAATIKPAGDFVAGWEGVAVEVEAPSAVVFVVYGSDEAGWTVEELDTADPTDPEVHDRFCSQYEAIGWIVGAYLAATN